MIILITIHDKYNLKFNKGLSLKYNLVKKKCKYQYLKLQFNYFYLSLFH